VLSVPVRAQGLAPVWEHFLLHHTDIPVLVDERPRRLQPEGLHALLQPDLRRARGDIRRVHRTSQVVRHGAAASQAVLCGLIGSHARDSRPPLRLPDRAAAQEPTGGQVCLQHPRQSDERRRQRIFAVGLLVLLPPEILGISGYFHLHAPQVLPPGTQLAGSLSAPTPPPSLPPQGLGTSLACARTPSVLGWGWADAASSHTPRCDGRISPAQVTFLHVFHHSSITIVTGIAIQIDNCGDTYLASLLNSWVSVTALLPD
jgi:hypothetical protein